MRLFHHTLSLVIALIAAGTLIVVMAGQYIVAGGSDGSVTLFNRDGEVLWSDTSDDRRHTKEYNHTNTGAITVTLADDAQYIAAGYGDSIIRVFERQ